MAAVITSPTSPFSRVWNACLLTSSHLGAGGREGGCFCFEFLAGVHLHHRITNGLNLLFFFMQFVGPLGFLSCSLLYRVWISSLQFTCHFLFLSYYYFTFISYALKKESWLKPFPLEMLEHFRVYKHLSGAFCHSSPDFLTDVVSPEMSNVWLNPED